MENPIGQVNKLAHAGFGVAFLIILVTLGISFWGHHQAVLTFEAVIHNEEVSAELLRLFVDLKVAEDQQREFLGQTADGEIEETVPGQVRSRGEAGEDQPGRRRKAGQSGARAGAGR